MLQDLDPTLIDALDELRREFDDKLNQQRQAFEQLVGSPSQPGEVEPEVDAAEPSPVAIAPEAVAGLDPLEELKLAAAEIDRSESQGDVLDALIRGALRFSSRTALFLCRDGAFHGWGGAGFGDKDSTIKDLALEAPAGSAWEQILAGEGGICLSADDCSVLLDQIGTDGAEIGVLVPFILRRQVAAVVYSDRTSTDPSFNISGLQLLSFLAGQTVETLPIRERASTDSLQLAVAPEIPLAAPADEIAAPIEVEPEDETPYLPEPQIEEPAAEELAIEEPTSEEPTIESPPPKSPPSRNPPSRNPPSRSPPSRSPPSRSPPSRTSSRRPRRRSTTSLSPMSRHPNRQWPMSLRSRRLKPRKPRSRSSRIPSPSFWRRELPPTKHQNR